MTAAPTIPGPVCTPNTGEMRKISNLAIFRRVCRSSASSCAFSAYCPCSTVTRQRFLMVAMHQVVCDHFHGLADRLRFAQGGVFSIMGIDVDNRFNI